MKTKKLREILKENRGSIPTKFSILHLFIKLEYQRWYPIRANIQPFYLLISQGNYLITIFMNINENIRNERESFTES